MVKIWKIILIAITTIGFVGFLAIGYWYKTEGPAMAIDYNTNTEIVCEEPIPVGIAINTTVDFLDQIYQRYQGDEVKTASKAVDDLMAAIAGNGGKVCDFNDPKNGCKAQVGTGGPDATVQLTSGVGVEALTGTEPIHYTYTVPSCKLKEATGNPCPDLSSYVGQQTPAEWAANPKLLSLDGLANSLTAQADNIHGLFDVADTPVPFGLTKSGEKAGETMITKAELVKRYIDDIDSWFAPNPQKNTCALSELDRTRIAQGKMGDKYPMQCMDALSKEMYTPKAWSEECKDECQTFTQKCKDCLAQCKGNSVYASLNCKIYSTGSNKLCAPPVVVNGPTSQQCCGQLCADGFNSQCKECLCQDLTQEQCLDWICGGSKANWVCCHEEPIQNPRYYAYDQVFATIDVMEPIKNPDGTTGYIIVSRDDKFGNAYANMQKASELVGGINVALLMGNAFRESSLGTNLGKCTISTPTIKIGGVYVYASHMYDDDIRALERIVSKLKVHLNYQTSVNDVKVSCALLKNKGTEFDGHGGAVGPAQFRPATWEIYDDQVMEKTGELVANPWFERDAYLAKAIMLKEKMDESGGSEREAARKYIGSGPAAELGADQTMCMKKEIQKEIDANCFVESSARSSLCAKNLEGRLDACRKNPTAQKFIDRALAFLMFWK